MKYLSFDLGLAHTGVAISHEGLLAQGLTTIETSDLDKLLHHLLNLIAQHQPDRIIIGLPNSGPIKELAQQIQTQIQARVDIESIFVDEDFSTRLAQQALIASNTGRQNRQLKQHQAAAATVLQTYLDNLLWLNQEIKFIK